MTPHPHPWRPGQLQLLRAWAEKQWPRTIKVRVPAEVWCVPLLPFLRRKPEVVS
jgi:hypothetical protein